jgi:hypothetical protein
MTNAGVGSRLDTYIDIPLEIGVPHFISDDCGHGDDGYEPNFTNFKLSLLAVICHRGKSLDAGHYIALVRSREDRNGEPTQWLRFDDLAQQRITSVDIQKALKDECPYLLFYQTRPIEDDEVSSRGEPPSYDEATTDNSNGELSRVTTTADLSEPVVITTVIPTPLSEEILTTTIDTESTATTESTNVTDIMIEELPTVVADPEVYTKTADPPVKHLEVKEAENVKPNSIDLIGLAAPSANNSKQSLDIPRGRSSFQSDSRRSMAAALSDNEVSAKGTSSVPATPGDDHRASWLGSSRRNSITKGWLKPRSRPPSQTGENRISMSMSRLKNAMSKDKLAENGSKEEHIHFDSTPEKPQAEKTDIPKRNKSLKHKKGKRSSSIGLGKMLDKGEGGEKSKKMPDRECIVM